MKKKHKNQEINLSNAFRVGMLNEGLFDKLMDFLEFLTRSYYSGIEAYDKSGMVQTNAGKSNFDPKKNVGDQVHAAACVAQLVSYAIQGWISQNDYFNANLTAVAKAAGSDELFTRQSQEVLESINRTLGMSMGALSDSDLQNCSKKVYVITKSMKPSEQTSETLKNFHAMLSQINQLDLPASIRKITRSEQAQKFMRTDKDIARALEANTREIESTFDKALSNIQELSFRVADLEDLIEEKANAPEAVSSSEPVKSPTFENRQETLVRNIIREALVRDMSRGQTRE